MVNISTIKVGDTSYGITATPTAHASTATTYGAASASNYGHVKLSDNYTSSAGAAASGIGASSAAVYNAYNTLNSNLSTKLSAKIITQITTIPTSGNLIIDYPTGVTHTTTYTVFVSLTYEEGEYYGTAIAPSYGTDIDLGSRGATIIITNDDLRGKTVWLHYLVTE